MSERTLRVMGPCPLCRQGVTLEVGSRRGSPSCPACGSELLVQRSDLLLERGALDRCLLCAESRLFRQADLEHRLAALAGGAGLVLAAAASWWLAAWWPLAAILAAEAAGAWVLLRTPSLAVCYRCRATYRGAAENPDLRPFDPGLADRVEASAGGRERS